MNVLGYLQKFGNRSFGKTKFKETDSLIFSQLGYLKFERVFESVAKGRKFVPLKDFLNLPDQSILTDGTSNPAAYKELWDEVMATKRFGTLKIGHVRSVFDEEKDTQFMAMTFKSEGWTKYIVFRGTDGTLCGWKEDCNLSVFNEVPAQLEAVKYVNDVVSWSLCPFNIIGHSKGGNLAEFAALKMRKRYGLRLKGVYNHDGPGFNSLDIFDQKILKKLTPKLHKNVPGESVIGMLLNQVHDYKVISAEKATFFQHSIFKWVLDDKTGDLVQLEDRSKASKAWETSISNWLNPLPFEEKQLLVNTLFDILRWDGRTTIYEVTKLSKIDFTLIGIKALIKYDRNTRTFLIKNLWGFYKLRMAAKEEIEPKEKKKKAQRKAKEKGND